MCIFEEICKGLLLLQIKLLDVTWWYYCMVTKYFTDQNHYLWKLICLLGYCLFEMHKYRPLSTWDIEFYFCVCTSQFLNSWAFYWENGMHTESTTGSEYCSLFFIFLVIKIMWLFHFVFLWEFRLFSRTGWNNYMTLPCSWCYWPEWRGCGCHLKKH